jgi:hypothetical protein
MHSSDVKRHNISEAVEYALERCDEAIRSAQQTGGAVRDLTYAVDALTFVRSELQGGPQRPRRERSCAFTRLVVDQGDENLAVPAALRELIVAIEGVYRRI